MNLNALYPIRIFVKNGKFLKEPLLLLLKAHSEQEWVLLSNDKTPEQVVEQIANLFENHQSVIGMTISTHLTFSEGHAKLSNLDFHSPASSFGGYNPGIPPQGPQPFMNPNMNPNMMHPPGPMFNHMGVGQPGGYTLQPTHSVETGMNLVKCNWGHAAAVDTIKSIEFASFLEWLPTKDYQNFDRSDLYVSDQFTSILMERTVKVKGGELKKLGHLILRAGLLSHRFGNKMKVFFSQNKQDETDLFVIKGFGAFSDLAGGVLYTPFSQ